MCVDYLLWRLPPKGIRKGSSPAQTNSICFPQLGTPISVNATCYPKGGLPPFPAHVTRYLHAASLYPPPLPLSSLHEYIPVVKPVERKKAIRKVHNHRLQIHFSMHPLTHTLIDNPFTCHQNLGRLANVHNSPNLDAIFRHTGDIIPPSAKHPS